MAVGCAVRLARAIKRLSGVLARLARVIKRLTGALFAWRVRLNGWRAPTNN